jgi:hypothetical protein
MKKITLIIAFLVSACIANAQSYTFQVQTRDYVHLPSPVSLNQGEVWEDTTYLAPLGFTFKFFGHDFNYTYVGDGYIILWDTITDNYGWVDAFFTEIMDKGTGTNASESPISYQLEGAAGSRTYTIEWRNVGFVNDATGGDSISFQIKLYETSNIIEAHYGPNSVVPASYGGSSGAWVGLYYENPEEYLYLTGNAAAPTTASNDNNPITGTPAVNTVYQFTPTFNSISKVVNEAEFTLFPNPVNGFFRIANLEEAANITVMDIKGKTVLSSWADSDQLINTSSLDAGMYMVIIEASGKRRIEKFIKE